jgi:thioredoxin reductase (NADPH)
MLFSRGDRAVDIFLVLEGAIEIYDNGPDGAPRVFTVHAERQFTGELDLFNSREILSADASRRAAAGRCG